MQTPSFYTQVSPIRLYDPLSDFLGAFQDGIMEINYLDCVKLAGHSCPTVAGAYLMAQEGLKALYPNTFPQRGNIQIEIKEEKTAGVAGVVGNVIAFIVGASDEGGFKGIKGNFARNNLLFYGNNVSGEVKLTRMDTMVSVTLSYNPSGIPTDAQIPLLMGKCLKNIATKEEKILFGSLWQKRVEAILLNDGLDSQLITIGHH